MLPPAPPLFSITICWPQTSESRLARTRATASVPPPAGNGATRRTKRRGQACACAHAGRVMMKLGASADAAVSEIRRRRSIMDCPYSSPVDLDSRVADDRAPFVHLGLEVTSKLVGRRADQRRAERLQS